MTPEEVGGGRQCGHRRGCGSRRSRRGHGSRSIHGAGDSGAPLRPFTLRPFSLRPFTLRPFNLRPLNLRPLNPFSLRSLNPHSLNLHSRNLHSFILHSRNPHSRNLHSFILRSLPFLLALLVGCSGSELLTPTDPPTILAAPTPRVVPLGTTWILSVTASGGDLRYQWRRNGAPISGANGPEYSFSPTLLSSGGSYDVVVMNDRGTVYSEPIEVRVVTADGPWLRDLRIAVGSAPGPWGPIATFVPRAGVPHLARRVNGELLATFQWFPLDDPQAFDRVAVVRSTDGGRSWGPPIRVVIEGFPGNLQRPFDPTLAVLPDGRVRLYFTSGPILSGGGIDGNSLGFYSAISTDGVNYQFEPGVRFFPGASTVDCTLLFWEGVWHLVSPLDGPPSAGAYHATSPDGLTFTRLPDIPGNPTASWIGNLTQVGGDLRFYGGSPQGIWHSTYTPGVGWSPRVTLPGVPGGDPAIIEAEPERWILLLVG